MLWKCKLLWRIAQTSCRGMIFFHGPRGLYKCIDKTSDIIYRVRDKIERAV